MGESTPVPNDSAKAQDIVLPLCPSAGSPPPPFLSGPAYPLPRTSRRLFRQLEGSGGSHGKPRSFLGTLGRGILDGRGLFLTLERIYLPSRECTPLDHQSHRCQSDPKSALHPPVQLSKLSTPPFIQPICSMDYRGVGYARYHHPTY